MQTTTFLSIFDLWIERGEKDLCKRFCMNLAQGEVVRVLGENGTGKSSFLKVIAGVLEPLDGRITYDGEDVTKGRYILQKNMLYIGHLSGIQAVLTVVENLLWYCPDATQEQIAKALFTLNLTEYSDSFVKHLSAGQQQRVALARLWLSKKTLWLLDEPFSSLDKEGTKVLEKHIQQHVSSGGCVILTTHQPLTEVVCRDVILEL